MNALFALVHNRDGKFVSLDEHQASSSSKKSKWETCSSDWLALYANSMHADLAKIREQQQKKLEGGTIESASMTHTLTTFSSSFADLMDNQPFDDWDDETSIINDARAGRNAGLKPLVRCDDLDALARQQVIRMASSKTVKHSDLNKLLGQMTGVNHKLGENVSRGKTWSSGHRKIMDEASNYCNVIDPKYREMGVATAKGKDGKIYICQLFRG